MPIDNLEKSIELIEKRIVRISFMLIAISLSISYFLLDSVISYYRVKAFENALIDSVLLAERLKWNESDRSYELDRLNDLYKDLDEVKKDSAEMLWNVEYDKIIEMRRRLLSLLKGRYSLFEFSLSDKGIFEYKDGVGVNKFWLEIDSTKIPVKATELKENVWKINFKSFYEDLNSSYIGPFTIRNSKEVFLFETALKMQNFLMSLEEIDAALERIRKLDRSQFYTKKNDNPDIQKRIESIELSISNVNAKLEKINSDTNEYKKKYSEKINYKDKKEELRGKNFQTLTISNFSVSFFTVLYLYPLIVFLCLLWLRINANRLLGLAYRLKFGDSYYSAWFLMYPDVYSRIVALLILISPMLMGLAVVLYLMTYSKEVSDIFGLPISIGEIIILAFIQVGAIIIAFFQAVKILNTLASIFESKKVK
ncbi:Uncharacterized protein XB16_3339 [Leptospira santarosai]|uniref:Uncharacterized protein n=1 Tax=Leptospira santarosai TaxID=28183 RepID=A0A2P1QXJ2_9LEPT|nr:Uncharacterized protein XB16_3339 [Leptospira santarosai]